MALTVRSLIAFGSGSVYVYFLQPTLGTMVVAAAFLLSVPAGRPLAERLAADFCPLPQSLLAKPAVRRFFMRISLLWALTNMLNAVVTLWLLVSQDLGTYLVAKTFVSWVITGSAIAISTVWFKRSMRRHGVLRGRRARSSPPPERARPVCCGGHGELRRHPHDRRRGHARRSPVAVDQFRRRRPVT